MSVENVERYRPRPPTGARIALKGAAAAAVILFGSLNGCTDLGRLIPEDVFAQRVTVPYTPLGTAFSVLILEQISREQNSFHLHLESYLDYPGQEPVVAGSIQRDRAKFVITVDSIHSQPDQSGPRTPARGDFELGYLEPGFYPLVLRMNGVDVQGLLILESDVQTVSLQLNNVFHLRYPTLRRVPRETIWGLIGYPSHEWRDTVYVFLDSLMSAGARWHGLANGEYYYFRVEGVGRPRFALHTSFEYYTPFLLRFTPDTSVTRGIVKRFSKQYPDSLEIQLYGGRGEVFLSWELRGEP